MSTPHAPHHDHDHSHAPHAHMIAGAGAGRRRKLLFAFVLTVVTMVAEVVGGLWSGSLALLADAAHMMVDALALLLAFVGAWMATRPADARRTYGYGRMEVLAGFVNALSQFVLVGWIIFEAIQRLRNPGPILSGVMLVVAVIGLVVNLLVLRTLHGHAKDDVNLAGASLHVLGDLLGSVAAVAAALVVRWLGWLWADPVLSIFVSLLILGNAWRLLRMSTHILLEGVPEGVDTAAVESSLRSVDTSIRTIHHVHIWQLASGSRMATLHAELDDPEHSARAMAAMKHCLSEEFGIQHATIQIELEGCADDQLHCPPPGASG